MNNYKDFIRKKELIIEPSGFEVKHLNNNLMPYQKAIVKWALKKGKSALFEDTGIGKTIQQLAWSEAITRELNGDVLILAPLAVSKQTIMEGEKFGIKVNLCETNEDVKKGINITNYEKLHKFNTNSFLGVVLDESSILKSYTGKTTMELIEIFKSTNNKSLSKCQ